MPRFSERKEQEFEETEGIATEEEGMRGRSLRPWGKVGGGFGFLKATMRGIFFIFLFYSNFL